MDKERLIEKLKRCQSYIKDALEEIGEYNNDFTEDEPITEDDSMEEPSGDKKRVHRVIALMSK